MSGEFAFDETYGRLLKFLQKYYFKVRDRTDTDADVRELDKILAQCEWIQRIKELEDEVMALKEQNKELMRDNIQLREPREELIERHMCEIAAMRHVNEKLQRDYDSLCDKLSDSERKAQEMQWYDADKCLPLPGREVYIVYKSRYEQEHKDGVKAVLGFNNDYSVDTDDGLYCLLVFKRYHAPPKPPITHSYPGVIEKWRYADE